MWTSQGEALVPELREARGFAGRALGLMGRRALPEGQGLWLAPCGSVHTCFMRFALDLVFLDREHRVVRTVAAARPWRFFSGGRGAQAVVEVRHGWLDLARLPPGTQVRLA